MLQISYKNGISNLEDKYTTLSRNVGNGIYMEAATYPRKTKISATPIRELQTELANLSKVDSVGAFRKGIHRLNSCTNGITKRT